MFIWAGTYSIYTRSYEYTTYYEHYRTYLQWSNRQKDAERTALSYILIIYVPEVEVLIQTKNSSMITLHAHRDQNVISHIRLLKIKKKHGRGSGKYSSSDGYDRHTLVHILAACQFKVCK